jgi:hypothetical protein
MLFTDLFGSRLMTARFTSSQINGWLANPLIGNSLSASENENESSYLAEKKLFDCLRGKNSDECIAYLSQAMKKS